MSSPPCMLFYILCFIYCVLCAVSGLELGSMSCVLFHILCLISYIVCRFTYYCAVSYIIVLFHILLYCFIYYCTASYIAFCFMHAKSHFGHISHFLRFYIQNFFVLQIDNLYFPFLLDIKALLTLFMSNFHQIPFLFCLHHP